MSKGLPILALLLVGAVGGIHYASSKGVGVPKPRKEPISIREQSVRHRTGGRGYYYFMGGGPRYGK